MIALLALVISTVTFFIIMPIFFAVLRMLGVYVIVKERQARVYILFGNVVATLTEPGLHFLWAEMGVQALIVNWLGRCQVVDLRLDQEYLRSQPVNSEEGAPMGIGVWYEMCVADPKAYLFRNADPRGSLRANVGNATVRTLSNLDLAAMLESRHTMSHAVRADVAPRAAEWGYEVGSVYVRKVHFRDPEMIHQIEEKVVNRLRQVTSAIRQEGANQVSIIRSSAEREAAIEFAKASALRPSIVGQALANIAKDREVASALFTALETQKLLESDAKFVLMGSEEPGLNALLAFSAMQEPATPKG